MIPFNIKTKGYSTIRVRGRSGIAGNNKYYWDNNGYSYAVDNVPVTFTGPGVAITGPTDVPVYVTDSNKLNLSGIASYDVTSVRWANFVGGNGLCTGTTSWSANGITLQPGANRITVMAYGPSGSTISDILNVTYIASGSSIKTIKGLSNDSTAQLTSKTVTAVFSDCFYISEDDRSSGLMVRPTFMPQGITVGSLVNISGKIKFNPSEPNDRYISHP